MTQRTATSSMPRDLTLLTVMLAGSGVLHLARPGFFTPMVPRVLPRRHELVLISGAAELTTAALLVSPATRRVGGAAAFGLLAAVWPANGQMAVDAVRRRRPWWYTVGTLLRLPLQVPLLRIAARAAGRAR